MARLKYTKQELKAQRDALHRYERFLPTLLLKKIQLQHEVRRVESALEEKLATSRTFHEGLNKWVLLFDEDAPLDTYLQVRAIQTSEGNIAGVSVPILESITFDKSPPDIYRSPAWLDEGIAALEQDIRLRLEIHLLREQRRLLADELRTTTQRVNLFEKVKIPDCRENIRTIRIMLGDQQTAEVVRSKIAKTKGVVREVPA